MSSRDGEAFEPTLAQLISSPSAPELVDVGAPALDEGARPRYETGDVLGEGGMGEVRLCRDLRIGRRVAMKRLKNGLGSRSDARTRFLREARVQGQLEHPAVVPVYDLGCGADGTEFFTMKRVRGRTLAEVLVDGKQSQRKLLTAFSSVCLAIHYAHTRGVLHRDLKPSNLMLGDFGEVYVLDWGLAKVTGAPDPAAVDDVADTPSPDGARTQAGALLGTPGYIAPEVLEGAEPDAKSDVYALGAILFEILAGEPLHRGKAEERVRATLEGVERRPARETAPELVELCRRATSRDAAARLGSVRDLHEAVERYLDGDRDLGLRREASRRHTEAARLAGLQGKRELALRELGTAIALDPANDDARSRLVGLLTTPPEEEPPEAIAEMERFEDAALRTSARLATVAYLAFFFFTPLLLWLGVKNWGYTVPCWILFGLAALAAWGCSHGPSSSPLKRYTTLGLTCAALAALSMYFGPYVGVPALLGFNAMGFATRRRRFKPWAIMLGTVLALVVPLVLEWVGVLPPSYAFEKGEIHILPRSVGFPALGAAATLFITQLATVVAAILYASHTQAASADAERRLHLHMWQLRQLLPEGAAVETPSPDHFKATACSLLH